MNMKQKANPAIIAAAVAVLVIALYGMYSVFFRPQSPPASAENAPAYARERGMAPGTGGAAPDYADYRSRGGAPPGVGAQGGPPGGRPTYGQGGGYGGAPTGR